MLSDFRQRSARPFIPHEVIAGKVEERLGKEVAGRVGGQGTEVADHAGGGEAVLGGQHGVEVGEPATLRRRRRSQEDGDGLQVGVAHARRGHRASAAANASGGTAAGGFVSKGRVSESSPGTRTASPAPTMGPRNSRLIPVSLPKIFSPRSSRSMRW